jgi:hypothetical protein
MTDSSTAMTTVLMSHAMTLCRLTVRRIELVRTEVSVAPNVVDAPIER